VVEMSIFIDILTQLKQGDSKNTSWYLLVSDSTGGQRAHATDVTSRLPAGRSFTDRNQYSKETISFQNIAYILAMNGKVLTANYAKLKRVMNLLTKLLRPNINNKTNKSILTC